jgi:hypothetical protein
MGTKGQKEPQKLGLSGFPPSEIDQNVKNRHIWAIEPLSVRNNREQEMVDNVSSVEINDKVNRKLNRARKKSSLLLFRLGQL